MSDLVASTTPQTQEIAKSIYEVDITGDDLFDDSKDYVPLAISGGQKDYDPTWKAHRVCKLNSPTIDWKWLQTKKEVEEKKTVPQEVQPIHNFVALRGIPIAMQYGFRLTQTINNETKTICQTTRLEELLGERSRVVEDKNPLDVPLNRIYKSKKENTTPNGWLLNHPHVKLYGSRPPVGMPADAHFNTPRECVDCVRAGEHYIGSEEEFLKNGQIPVCRMEGFMLFCVTEIGVQDASDLLEDPENGRVKVEWKKISEARIYTVENGERKLLDKPFILKITGLGLSQHQSVGKGEYDWHIYEPGEGNNHCYLPEGRPILSTGDYYKFLNDPKFYGTRHRKLKGNKLGYLVPTELYIARLKEKKANQDYIPVFSPITDPAVIEAGQNWTPIDWMRTGLAVLQTERAAVLGEPAPAALAETPQQATLPAPKKVTKKAPAAPAPMPAAEETASDKEFEPFDLEGEG